MSTTIQHTDACIASDAKYKMDYDAWNEKWPNACDNCRGYGSFNSPGSYWEPPDCEPCPDCTDKGICARCGAPGLTSEDRGNDSTGEGPCIKCGWNYDDGQPPLREDPCECEEEWLDTDEFPMK